MPKSGYKTVKWLFGKEIEIPEDWEVQSLSKISKNKPEYGSGDAAISFDGSLPRYVRITDIDNNGNLKKEQVSVKLENNEKYILENNDFLFARTGSVGRTFLYYKKYGKCVFAGYLIRFRLNEEKLLPLFLKFYTHSKNYWVWIQSELTHGVQPNINAQQYLKLIIPIPPIKQQQKIASILSNVDNLIDSYDKTIQLTKKLKKGLMQTLLTQGIGHKKFKKVTFGLHYIIKEIPHEWKVSKVGDVCTSIVSGRNKPEKFDGEIPWLTTEDFEKLYVEKSKNNLRVSESELKEKAGKTVPPNSVLISCVGDLGLVGINKIKVSMNQQLHAFVCSNEIEPYFLSQFLSIMKNYMKAIATTTTVPYMNKANCESIIIVIPTIDEQKKITTILKEVDSKITKLELKKKSAESLKKGLMQKLLTGQIRVSV